MSSTWSLKLPNLLLKKIRGSKEPLNHSNPHNNSSNSNNPTTSSSLSIIRPHYVEDQLTRDCKEFYERRVHLTSKAEDSGPSSLCSSGYFSLPYQQPESPSPPSQESQLEDEGEDHEGEGSRESPVTESEQDPLQSKILHLRKEFLSLIEVDNQLFKQLLNLNDAIQDFKELHHLGNKGLSGEDPYLSQKQIYRSKSFLEDTKTFQRQRISFPATRKNRRVHTDEEEEDPNRMFYTLPSSKAKKKLNKERSQEWRVSSSRSSASSSSSSSSYERRSWKRYSETNNSLDSGIHADSCGEHSDHYSP